MDGCSYVHIIYIDVCSPHQQFVKVLDVIRFEERQVPRGLVVHLLHGAVLCLHVEARHASDGGGGGRQLTGRGTDGHVACWRGQDLGRRNRR